MRADPTSAIDRRVLIVDDETGVRDLMARWLAAGGYDVVSASTAEEALVQLGQLPSAVALCDIRMPGRGGLWLAERIRQEYPETALIMATGMPDDGDFAERDGVVDYLTKPFGRDRLRQAVQRGLDWHWAAAGDSRRWRQTLEEEIAARRERLAAALMALPIDSRETVEATLAMVMSGEPDALAHGRRVADLAVDIGGALGCGRLELGIVSLAGLVHDVGKLAMPEAIRRKPAPLAAEEWALVRRHSAIASDIVSRIPYLSAAAPIVRDATERMDGRGYPRGVAAATTALGARIVAVADAFDTMTRPRVFRSALDPLQAVGELDRSSGTQFDPDIVRAFKSLKI